jgi:hypothetical protein
VVDESELLFYNPMETVAKYVIFDVKNCVNVRAEQCEAFGECSVHPSLTI